MRVATLIIGIDGWEKYTKPLLESLYTHSTHDFIIDNASKEPYPRWPNIYRTERLCYSAAINRAQHEAAGWVNGGVGFDWFIVLSNDVLCTGPFVDKLASLPPNCIAGPCLKETHGYQYLEGWCVCVPANIWQALGGWDERFQMSSWEDVDFSQMALEHGFDIAHVPDLPFVHLDQRQRFTLSPNYWDTERHNIELFMRKREAAK